MAANRNIMRSSDEQKYYEERLKLKTITNDMQQYSFWEEHIVEAEIFCGRRLVAHAKLL